MKVYFKKILRGFAGQINFCPPPPITNPFLRPCVWQHIGQSITTTSRHRRDITSDVQNNVKPKQTNATFEIINIKIWIYACLY